MPRVESGDRLVTQGEAWSIVVSIGRMYFARHAEKPGGRTAKHLAQRLQISSRKPCSSPCVEQNPVNPHLRALRGRRQRLLAQRHTQRAGEPRPRRLAQQEADRLRRQAPDVLRAVEAQPRRVPQHLHTVTRLLKSADALSCIGSACNQGLSPRCVSPNCDLQLCWHRTNSRHVHRPTHGQL